MFIVICEPNNMYLMVILDPNNLYLAAKQPSREPNLELACDSSRQISALLHCSCSQAVFSLIMCDPSALHVCCDLGAKQLLCYCCLGAKQLRCLWLFGRQTISMFIDICGITQLQGFTVICEPNNIYVYGYLGAKQPQFGSQTTFKGATSGTFMCFLQTNLFIVTWFMEPSSFCFEDYV